MVGADRFGGSAGERDDSYWASIDYPEPRPRPVLVSTAFRTRERQSARRALIAGFVAAVLVVGGGAFAVGRVEGHAPVPGLHDQVDAQRRLLTARAATIARQARALAADEAQLRSQRARVSQSAATQTACRNAIAAADRAFGTESDALHALANADLATANALTNRFGNELDAYATARSTCVGSTNSA